MLARTLQICKSYAKIRKKKRGELLLMVYTYISDITPLFQEDVYRDYYQKLPKQRKEKADKLKRKENKCQSVGVYSLYQKIVKEKQQKESFVYNFSHSGNYVVCSISEKENSYVGCDIENIKEVKATFMNRYYNAEEIRYVEEGEQEEEKRSRLIRLWTIKESFMKAVRLGSNLATKSFTVIIDKKDVPILINKPAAFTDSFGFYSRLYQNQAWITVCSNDVIEKEIHVIKL